MNRRKRKNRPRRAPKERTLKPKAFAFCRWKKKDSTLKAEIAQTTQHELLTNEQSYQSPALNLSSYGITNGVYGYISAPSIGMELPIYLGGNDFNMASGAAHMTCTSLPVGGNSTNCVLSGHSGYIGRIFFDYIPNLSIGDEITVENYWNTLTYKVIDKQIHKKDESADCYITEGRDLLTLITCVSNGRGGFDRFYLISERKSRAGICSRLSPAYRTDAAVLTGSI